MDHDVNPASARRRPGGSAVALDDAVAVIGGFPVLAGATLDVDVGEVVLLQGPNGAGKTSVLRLCAGLLPIERGAGSVLGLDLATQRDLIRPRVGFLAHRNGLYADLTVTENVTFWGETVGATPQEIRGAMGRLGVSGRLADVRVAKLSAGQRRRTALAALVARRAELWLLDEPHAGLDAEGRDELDAVLRQAVGAGATVVVASHELERAGSLADRIVEVVGGQIVGGEIVGGEIVGGQVGGGQVGGGQVAPTSDAREPAVEPPIDPPIDPPIEGAAGS